MKRERLFTTAEAAAFLGMSVAAFRAYVRRHRVNVARINHHLRFTQATLDAVKKARAKKGQR